MGIDPISWAVMGASTLAQAASMSAGNKQAKAAKTAAADNKAAIDAQTKAAEEASNKLNAKKPSFDAQLSKAMLAARNGGSGTMLTGSSGVTNPGVLGKSTLLGG